MIIFSPGEWSDLVEHRVLLRLVQLSSKLEVSNGTSVQEGTAGVPLLVLAVGTVARLPVAHLQVAEVALADVGLACVVEARLSQFSGVHECALPTAKRTGSNLVKAFSRARKVQIFGNFKLREWYYALGSKSTFKANEKSRNRQTC